MPKRFGFLWYRINAPSGYWRSSIAVGRWLVARVRWTGSCRAAGCLLFGGSPWGVGMNVVQIDVENRCRSGLGGLKRVLPLLFDS